MTAIDIGITVPFLVAVFFWARGSWKQSASDIARGVALLAIGVAGYVHFYSFTGVSDIPWAAALLCAGLSLLIAVIRRRYPAAARSGMILTAIAVGLAAILFAAEKRWMATTNSLLVIAPYRQAGTWVFDDPRAGLQAEPFVSGIPELIDRLVAEANIPDASNGFRLIFSPQPFPGYQTRVLWRRRENAGNWYYAEKYHMEGWLCAALFKYFKRAPREIYVKAERK